MLEIEEVIGKKYTSSFLHKNGLCVFSDINFFHFVSDCISIFFASYRFNSTDAILRKIWNEFIEINSYGYKTEGFKTSDIKTTGKNILEIWIQMFSTISTKIDQ